MASQNYDILNIEIIKNKKCPNNNLTQENILTNSKLSGLLNT